MGFCDESLFRANRVSASSDAQARGGLKADSRVTGGSEPRPIRVSVVGPAVGIGSRYELTARVPGVASPGHYRLRKRLDVDRDSHPGYKWWPAQEIESIEVIAEFDVMSGWIAMRGPRRPPQRLGDRPAGTTVVPVYHP